MPDIKADAQNVAKNVQATATQGATAVDQATTRWHPWAWALLALGAIALSAFFQTAATSQAVRDIVRSEVAKGCLVGADAPPK